MTPRGTSRPETTSQEEHNNTTPLLELIGVSAYYGGVPALFSADLTVAEGEMVVLLGANGAGKSTTLRAVSQTVRTAGRLLLDGRELGRMPPHAVARLRVAHVPEGRGTFDELTVAENLRLGVLARHRTLRAAGAEDLNTMFTSFPALAEARDRQAGGLSGGQQQQLAVARALLGRPRLLLVDEMSLGLAPLVTEQLFQILRELQQSWGLSILLAEQNARLSLAIVDRAYVLETGRIVASGPAADLRDDETLAESYLGVAPKEAEI